MKKFVTILVLCFTMFSCDYILKPGDKEEAAKPQQVETGTDTDKDDKGCVISAGYRWSALKEDCIRPVEEGYRLNSIDLEEGQSTYKSAFVTFDEDKEKAELFLPNVRTSNILKKDKSGIYSDGHWVLNVNSKYQLQKDGTTLYIGAKVQEGQITGNDDPQQ